MSKVGRSITRGTNNFWMTRTRSGKTSALPLPGNHPDIVTEPMRLEQGTVRVPDGPGLGIELDEEKVATYRVDT